MSEPANGDPVAFFSSKGVHGGTALRMGLLVTYGPKLSVVWSNDEYHGGMDIVFSKDVYADPDEARARKSAEFEQWKLDNADLVMKTYVTREV
jgi:hypothetical protein